MFLPGSTPAAGISGETSTTGPNGFRFDGLFSNSYGVRPQVPDGFVASSNVVERVVMVRGQEQAVDFATQALPALVTGLLFEDLNGNGAQDVGERPQANALVFADLDQDGQPGEATVAFTLDRSVDLPDLAEVTSPLLVDSLPGVVTGVPIASPPAGARLLVVHDTRATDADVRSREGPGRVSSPSPRGAPLLEPGTGSDADRTPLALADAEVRLELEEDSDTLEELLELLAGHVLGVWEESD